MRALSFVPYRPLVWLVMLGASLAVAVFTARSGQAVAAFAAGAACNLCVMCVARRASRAAA